MGPFQGGGACIMFIHLLVFVEYIEQLFIVLAADSLVSLCGYLLMDHRHELHRLALHRVLASSLGCRPRSDASRLPCFTKPTP